MADQQPRTATTSAPQPPPPTTRRPLPQFLLVKILTMVLQNGLALATHQARPHTVAIINSHRTELVLHCPFFDPEHQPEELRPRTRPGPVSFTEIVVLIARLLRVLMRGGQLTEEEQRERVEVRNECLDQPFFRREMLGSERPFSFGEGVGEADEACVV